MLCVLCAKLCEGSFCSQSLRETVSKTGRVAVSGRDRCLSDERPGLSHAAVLLPGLVHHGGVWGVQGRSEGTQEASQQREAQPAPRTKHGPAVTVADVLWYPKHVARVAGQFKVDPGHTCAKGDYAARPCRRERNTKSDMTAAATHFHLLWCTVSLRHPYPRPYCPSVVIQGSALYAKCILPPMRKRSPATYCIRSCSLQQPSMPMIQPNRMMDMAMPMKLAVILWRSAREKGQCLLGCGGSFSTSIHQNTKIKGELTERVPLILPYCLRQIDWQISGQR